MKKIIQTYFCNEKKDVIHFWPLEVNYVYVITSFPFTQYKEM